MAIFFDVCPRCRNHGHFIFSDDSCSYEVLSQSDALNMMYEDQLSGAFAGEDLDDIFAQISQSGLPLVIPIDTENLLQMEGDAEAYMRSYPIIHPETWGDRWRPDIDVSEEACAFCQEILHDRRPRLQ